jgi:hydrogenase expression/formation protein HypC
VVDINMDEARGALMGKVDFGGIRKEVCLAYLPDITIGEYTIVHVGFAITRIDEKSALETLRMFEELGLLDEELGEDIEPPVPAPCPLPSAWNGAPA